MASHLARRVLSSSTRSAARSSAPTRIAGRRFASSDAAHTAKRGNDLPWMIGSALVFGPIIAYLLMPATKDKAKHAAEHKPAQVGISKMPESSASSEGPAPSESDVEESTAQAVASDSPKDAQAAEEADPSPESDDGKVHGTLALTDADGTTVSAEEVDQSMKLAFDANSPKDAQREEENDAKYGSGSPGMTEEAERKPDQHEKPGKGHVGTFQDKEDSGPTNIGDARKGAAEEKKAPKQASQ